MNLTLLRVQTKYFSKLVSVILHGRLKWAVRLSWGVFKWWRSPCSNRHYSNVLDYPVGSCNKDEGRLKVLNLLILTVSKHNLCQKKELAYFRIKAIHLLKTAQNWLISISNSTQPRYSRLSRLNERAAGFNKKILAGYPSPCRDGVSLEIY